MKKILFLSILMAFIATANAQTLIPLYGSNTSANYDTITNAGTVYFTTATNALSANKTGEYSIQFKCANVSGTSTFKAILQGSNDGTNWTNVHQVEGTNGIHCDTLQVTSASPATWVFRIRPGSVHSVSTSTFLYTNAGKFKNLRVAFVGTGTQVTRISSVYAMND